MPATPLRSDELFPYRSVRHILANRKPVVHAVSSEDTVASALQLMSKHNIGLVVVLDGEQLIGVLSERDLARRAGQLGAEALRGLPVAALMTRDVVVCLPRLSCARTAPVSCTCAPSSVLVSVDLPAPDEPSITRVRPRSR